MYSVGISENANNTSQRLQRHTYR